jgi:hypothetical protein
MKVNENGYWGIIILIPQLVKRDSAGIGNDSSKVVDSI